MEELNKKNNLVSDVKYVLYRYCPVVEDRSNFKNRKEFGIHIFFGKDETNIAFALNNSETKRGLEEYIEVSHVVEMEEIEELIDFLKEDHGTIGFNHYDRIRNTAKYKFNINQDTDSISGINCETIELALHFRDNLEIEKKYLYFINKKYFNSSDIFIDRAYTNEVIKSYVDSLDKDGMMYVINRMSEEDIKKLLIKNLPQVETYIKDEPKVKQYFMER